MALPTPAQLGLPRKFTAWYPHQEEALERILLSERPYILVDAPTGSGKTLIAAAAAKLLRLRAFYACTTKALQDQFAKDFPYARVLKGRANYHTYNYPHLFPKVSCEDCEGPDPGPCKYCAEKVLDREGEPVLDEDRKEVYRHPCPYRIAKQAALGADMACINTAFLLVEANLVGGFSGWPLGILDEADTLEEQLMGHIELYIPQWFAALFMVNSGPKRRTKEGAWLQWAEGIRQQCLVLEHAVHYTSARQERRAKAIMRKLDDFCHALRVGQLWANCTQKEHDATGPWSFKPVQVSPYAKANLWRHAERWLLLSATFLGSDVFCRDMGLNRAEVEWIVLPSTFPKQRRPVYYAPTQALSRKTTDFAPLVERVVQVCKRVTPVLVHVRSYKLAGKVIGGLEKEGIAYCTYHNAGERRKALDWFKAQGGVLVAPSMERGVDLPYEECRGVVIAKCPFPSLGDKQVSMRLYATAGGKQWYASQTVRTIVQAAGRGMRAADDECEVWILDTQFGRLLATQKRLFPEWFREVLWMVEDGKGPVPLT